MTQANRDLDRMSSRLHVPHITSFPLHNPSPAGHAAEHAQNTSVALSNGSWYELRLRLKQHPISAARLPLPNDTATLDAGMLNLIRVKDSMKGLIGCVLLLDGEISLSR